ncbi:MAG: hypothetical protein H0W61_13445 [Bacteroidetes bacterium]|nr:hypothetical protein [Bacteroidota bacterium]
MNIEEYINSGILDLYVLGLTSEGECGEIELLASEHILIKQEIEKLRSGIEAYVKLQAVSPGPLVKPLLLATIEYSERIRNGEQPVEAPELTEVSRIEDYAQWLNRKDMAAPEKYEGVHVKIISHSPAMTCAIVWIANEAPPETHTDELEKFLIIEGECDIIVDGIKNHLVPGNYFPIPLHKTHMVKVTSQIPCKVILQRAAA